MSKRIHKFTISDEQLAAVLNIEAENHTNEVGVKMPIDAQILAIRTVNMKPRIFALVDMEAKAEERKFEVYPTGVDIPVADTENGFTYVGSFARNGKTFHVLEGS